VSVISVEVAADAGEAVVRAEVHLSLERPVVDAHAGKDDPGLVEGLLVLDRSVRVDAVVVVDLVDGLSC